MKVAVTSVLLPTATFEEEPSPITISMSGVLNLQQRREQSNGSSEQPVTLSDGEVLLRMYRSG